MNAAGEGEEKGKERESVLAHTIGCSPCHEIVGKDPPLDRCIALSF